MVRAAPLLLLALVCGAAARELHGMDKLGAMADGAKDVAGATVGAVGGVAGAVGDAMQAGFEGLKGIHEAKISGIREVVEAKISAARQVFHHGDGMRKLQGMDNKMGAMVDGAKDVAGATVGAVGSVADATQAYVHESIQGLKTIHEAKVSGLRDIVDAKISAARQVFGHGDQAGVSTPTAVPAQCMSAADVLAKSGNFSVLLAAAQAAGLGAALSDRSLRATLFAPTDRAFALLLADLDMSAEQLLARPELLQKILKYHVLPAPVVAANLDDGKQYATLLSAELPQTSELQKQVKAVQAAFDHKGKKNETTPEDGKLTIDTLKVIDLKKHTAQWKITVIATASSAEVIQADVQAGCPTVVHIIDAVLIPGLETEASSSAIATASAKASS
ncbi:Nex18 symbiotically induced [Chlorella sorokiniana]|uniref:Nex18 symbiotically induced n=1 Tax=Chlorella sorokiniana TaxID=3076 RepID=A0A2P6TCW3_CHLSO|nr:Nex18 symbiotically induced [Chlorella sorokiniana]|eukprot:PRW20481.1 Nex18 symbiotically induced [Chlorella sorokiniana]